MKQRRRQSEHVNHERWLVSYADFMTLLFAFFVVLYASSQVDQKKTAALAAAIEGAFQQLAIVPPGQVPAGREVLTKPGGMNGSLPVTHPTADKNLTGLSENDVQHLREQLERVLGKEIKNDKVTMRLGNEGLIVSLREVGFFNSGEATLLPEAKPVINNMARVLINGGFEIRVEGHTDNVPIHNIYFNSNWELSTARAMAVVELLTQQGQFDPRLLSLAGYSEYRPIGDNSTEEGRKANRRVDIVVVSRPTKTQPSSEHSHPDQTAQNTYPKPH